MPSPRSARADTSAGSVNQTFPRSTGPGGSLKALHVQLRKGAAVNRKPWPQLDALLARLPKKSARETYEELDAARRAAAATPPELTSIPMPTYPYGWSLRHPLGGTMRFACPLGCGWFHDENRELPLWGRSRRIR
ncbi:hypothetical protein [Streptomyces sp. Root369]|uniref:hypothetical protein n=1 Tax=Streptomyces sp. Root369 TaxID=1736523 RepID=UPI001300E245|nr:hypothetical protein [Streptomyces sp. Root369]